LQFLHYIHWLSGYFEWIFHQDPAVILSMFGALGEMLVCSTGMGCSEDERLSEKELTARLMLKTCTNQRATARFDRDF